MADNDTEWLIETSAFTKQITALLSDEDYADFQSRLAANPDIGVLIKNGGGIRKIRVAIGSRGKRGGARVIYYWAPRQDLILLLLAYSKNATTGSNAKPDKATCESREGGIRQWKKRYSMSCWAAFVKPEQSSAAKGNRPAAPSSVRLELGRFESETHLSQSEFARLMGVSVKTLQNWEQNRRRPAGPANAL